MALSNLYNWNSENAGTVPGTACGAGDEKPQAACGTACGTACGAGDEKPQAACGTACGAGDK